MLKKVVGFLVSIAIVALLAVAVYHLNKANEELQAESPEVTQPVIAPAEPSTITPALAEDEKAEIIEETKNVEQRIDASTDKAMIDSLDYISRQLDGAAQQQLQDDYSVIASVLTTQALDDGNKDDDSLAKVREAVNGKTAAELTEIATKLKPKD